jgi:hypothetical protein
MIASDNVDILQENGASGRFDDGSTSDNNENLKAIDARHGSREWSAFPEESGAVITFQCERHSDIEKLENESDCEVNYQLDIVSSQHIDDVGIVR